jgi:uncharacterized protein YndB with AHSA1/START domain
MSALVSGDPVDNDTEAVGLGAVVVVPGNALSLVWPRSSDSSRSHVISRWRLGRQRVRTVAGANAAPAKERAVTENSNSPIEATLHSAEGYGVVRMTSRMATDIDDLWSAITTPERLARWYGKVNGDLRVGGEYEAVVYSSGWEGRGRIEVCDPPRTLRVTATENDGQSDGVTAQLVTSGSDTILSIEVRGVPLENVWAYGVGWHTHVESLAEYLTGRDHSGRDRASWDARWSALEPLYQAKAVEPLES